MNFSFNFIIYSGFKCKEIMLIEVGLFHSKENFIIKREIPYHIKTRSITRSKNATQFENQKF